LLGGRGLRRIAGFGEGRTVSIDRVTLTSKRPGLTGRPDREDLVEEADPMHAMHDRLNCAVTGLMPEPLKEGS
jgi:hypothetical protein